MNHTTNATYPAISPSLTSQLAHSATTVGLFYAIVITTILCVVARNYNSNWEFWRDLYHGRMGPQDTEDIVRYFCNLFTHMVLISGTGVATLARVIMH
jgi:hypothetical protein